MTDTNTDYEASATRPKTAPRQQTRQVGGPRKVLRYTLDLEQNQHQFMKLWSLQHGVNGSKLMRTMLYLLEANREFADQVLAEIFAEPDEESPAEV